MLPPITLIFTFVSLSKQLTWSCAGKGMQALACTLMWDPELVTGWTSSWLSTVYTEAGSLTWIKSSLVWLIWAESLLPRTPVSTSQTRGFPVICCPHLVFMWVRGIYTPVFSLTWKVLCPLSHLLSSKLRFELQDNFYHGNDTQTGGKTKRNLKGTARTWGIIQELPKDSLILFGSV